MKLSQGDTVIVISGKDKGKKGTILRVLKDEQRVIVGDINMVTKHVKKTTQAEGRIVRFEKSIPASVVMMVDPKTGKPTRIGYRIDPKTGRKVRFAKASGTVLGRTKIEQKETQVKEVRTKPRDAEDTQQEQEIPAVTPGAKKTPFWKKISFGSDVASQSSAPQKAESGPGQSAPGHTRSASRGS